MRALSLGKRGRVSREVSPRHACCKVFALVVVMMVVGGGGGGGGGSFAAIELIGHLLFPVPPLRKSMFRKSMGSGDNGKPHKARTRRRHGNGPSQGSRTTVSLCLLPAKWTRGCACELVLVADVLERSCLNCIIMIFTSNEHCALRKSQNDITEFEHERNSIL